MEIVEEITLKARGGLGGIAEDASADLADMKYAERMILNDEFLKALAKLKVATVEGNVVKGGTILIDKSELEAAGYTGEVNGAAHKYNQEFVALEVPYFATSYTTENAQTKTYEETDEVTGEKTTVTRILPDKLRVYRMSDKFEVDRYACDASIKVKGTADKKGINNYHEPTTGMRLRADVWLGEHVDKLAKVLSKIGLHVEQNK